MHVLPGLWLLPFGVAKKNAASTHDRRRQTAARGNPPGVPQAFCWKGLHDAGFIPGPVAVRPAELWPVRLPSVLRGAAILRETVLLDLRSPNHESPTLHFPPLVRSLHRGVPCAAARTVRRVHEDPTDRSILGRRRGHWRFQPRREN